MTAAMLEPVLGNAKPPGEVAVSTQHHMSGVGTPDLVLDGAPDYLVWIEAKDWARESGDQLLRYWEALERQPAKYRTLVYLTRTGAAPPTVPEAYRRRWADLAKGIAEWRDREGDQVSPEQRWLVDDYLRYLKERGLAMINPLPADFADALRGSAAVVEKLNALQRMVNDQVQDAGWVKSACGFDNWNDWWCAYEPQPAAAYPPGSAFDYGMLNLLDGEPAVFIAGSWLGDSWEADERHRWIDHMLSLATGDAHPFEDPDQHQDERLCRTIAFQELRSGHLADQAEAMAEFATATFGLLRSNPPAQA